MPAQALVREASSLSLWTYKEGLLSRVAHDLRLEPDAFEATLELEGEQVRARVQVPVRALRVQGQVKDGRTLPLKDSDHREIEQNLQGAQVLDAARFPEIRWEGQGLRGPGGEAQLQGTLTLRDKSAPLPITTTVTAQQDGGFLVEGAARFLQSSFGITPYRALMGALRVQDGVRVSWSLRYRPV